MAEGRKDPLVLNSDKSRGHYTVVPERGADGNRDLFCLYSKIIVRTSHKTT